MPALSTMPLSKNPVRPRPPAAAAPKPAGPAPLWTFLTNHAHVLICLAQNPDQTLREVAERVGITERAVQKIVAELEQGGVLTRQRDGRRNTYQIHRERPLRHPVEAHHTVGDLLSAVK
jgi:biotin operon repressor